jgi:threonine dehydrogenase-like Zn-dependent dehydrogenase
VVKPRLPGICGSDSTRILLDFGSGGVVDSPLLASCTFPPVMGHEVVGEVVELQGDTGAIKVAVDYC